MATNYKAYYEAKRKAGEAYQDWIQDYLLHERALVIQQTVSKGAQYKVGESLQGFEIKFQQMYEQTNNLWIEISEKASPRPGPYVPSGIYRHDNSWLLITGDYGVVFFFGMCVLQRLHRSGRFPVRENTWKTSQGFLLSDSQARYYTEEVLGPDGDNQMRPLKGSEAEFADLVDAALRSDPKQKLLFDKWKR